MDHDVDIDGTVLDILPSNKPLPKANNGLSDIYGQQISDFWGINQIFLGMKSEVHGQQIRYFWV